MAILLKARSNVNARDGSGMTPAMYAAKALNFWALRMLEQAGADLSASARDRSTAMSWATEWEAMTVLQAEEQIRIIQLLQSQGLRHPRNPGLPDIVVSINMAITGQKADRMPAGTQALLWAAEAGRRRQVEALLAAGVDVNAASFGVTAAHRAARRKRGSVLAALAKRGADLTAGDARDRSVADYARKSGDKRLIEWVERRVRRAANSRREESAATPM